MDLSLKTNPNPSGQVPRITIREKSAYGVGSMAQNLGQHSIPNLANFVLNIGLGVNPVLVGVAQSIPRIWDAFSDPLMGYISDNTRSRWGRRRPYLLIGAVLMGFFFAAMWFLPQGWSEYTYFSYFLTMSLLFYTALTVFMVPWTAMGYEMTDDYHERTRLQGFANFFANASSLGMPWLFAMTQLDIFADTLQGARVVGVGLGVILILTGIVPALLCKEGHLKDAIVQEKTPLWTSLKQTFTNLVFVRLMLVVLLVGAAFFTIMTLSPYITIYYVMGGDAKAASVYIGWGGTAWVISALVLVGPISWAATKFTKKGALTGAICINLLGHVSKIWCYNPEYPWLVIVPPILLSAGFVGLWVICASMTADLCDLDELETGTRNEGMYGAAFGWFMKTGISVALLFGGVLLTITGFDAGLEVAQSTETIRWMRILEAGVPVPMVIGGLLLLRMYPLTEVRMREIREQLNQRRTLKENEL